MSCTKTVAPCAAKVVAIALPIPLPPPVITAFLFCKENIVLILCPHPLKGSKESLQLIVLFFCHLHCYYHLARRSRSNLYNFYFVIVPFSTHRPLCHSLHRSVRYSAFANTPISIGNSL